MTDLQPMKIPPLVLKNTIQTYAWGSHSAIQTLMGSAATDAPWAELWMGAHPKAPSQVNWGDRWLPLNEMIQKFPEKILGPGTARKFNGTLPYLFKILAAEQPLSIQAHPNALQAKAGFDRENQAGVDLASATRNYKDPFHKPECICALTPFVGLKGFRASSEILELIRRFCPRGLDFLVPHLRRGDYKNFFKSLMAIENPEKQNILQETRAAAEKQPAADRVAEWILRLHAAYPQDTGVLSPLFLNLFRLLPGEALFLPAGELHAYLSGMGIEIMANSDNVLRGGLTPKHVDVPELLSILNFRESKIEILVPAAVSACEASYPVPAEEFMLSVLDITEGLPCDISGSTAPDILICVDGAATLRPKSGNHPTIPIPKGTSVLIPAETGPYVLTGTATLYKAGVPGVP